MVSHCLHIVHLMSQKTNMIIIEVKTMKIFYKDLIKHETKIMKKRNDTINKLRKSIISHAKKNSVPMTTIL